MNERKWKFENLKNIYIYYFFFFKLFNTDISLGEPFNANKVVCGSLWEGINAFGSRFGPISLQTHTDAVQETWMGNETLKEYLWQQN